MLILSKKLLEDINGSDTNTALQITVVLVDNLSLYLSIYDFCLVYALFVLYDRLVFLPMLLSNAMHQSWPHSTLLPYNCRGHKTISNIVFFSLVEGYCFT